jgi:hypothetical protein
MLGGFLPRQARGQFRGYSPHGVTGHEGGSAEFLNFSTP